MNKITLIFFMMCAKVCFGQIHHYNKVDSFIYYDNARVIVYSVKGKVKRDTIFNQTDTLIIHEVGVMIQLDEKLKKLKH